MNFLCKIGIHIKNHLDQEDVTPTTYRSLERCSCGKKKRYFFGGEEMSEHDFPINYKGGK